MAMRYHHLRGSGDISGDSIKVRLLIIEASEHDDARNFALANTAPYIGNALRGDPDVTKEAPGFFVVEFEYKPETSVRDENPGEGNQNQQQNQDKGKSVPLEFSMTIGGHTERIYKSISTLGSWKRGGGNAPNFKGMIGVSPEKIEGVEIYSKQCDFTVTKHWGDITVGYLLTLMEATATTNDAVFLGCAKGSVLFIGADAGYTSGGEHPWTVSGKFAFKANQKGKDLFDDGNPATKTDIEGWMYVWYQFEKTTEQIGGVQYQIEIPAFAFLERVYQETDFKDLKMGL